MFREIILPIFRSTRLCVTVCGIMHLRCCRPPAAWKQRKSASRLPVTAIILAHFGVLWCIILYYGVWCFMVHYGSLWCIMHPRNGGTPFPGYRLPALYLSIMVYYAALWCMVYGVLWCIMVYNAPTMLTAGSLETEELRFQAAGYRQYTTSSNTQSSVPEDGRDHRPKHVELIGIINKPLLLHLVRVYIIYINDARSNKYQISVAVYITSSYVLISVIVKSVFDCYEKKASSVFNFFIIVTFKYALAMSAYTKGFCFILSTPKNLTFQLMSMLSNKRTGFLKIRPLTL